MIKAIIFDFDGLMVQTEHAFHESLRDALAAHQVDLPMSLFIQMLGGGYTFDPYEYLCEQTGQRPDRDAFWEGIHRSHQALADQEPLLPGVAQWIDDAERLALRRGVTSSSPHSWVDGHLRRLGIYDRFHTVICREDAPQRKPAPDLYLRTLEELGVQPSEAFVLEDTQNGITAAKAAGLYVIGVTHELTQHMDVSLADRLIPSLTELSLEDAIATMPDSRG